MARREWDVSTYTGRMQWLLHSRMLKQSDIVIALKRSSGNVSDVVSGKRELPWETTAQLIRVLETNGDFFHGLTDDDRPLDEIKKQKPVRLHVESEQLAELCDNQPEWLRRQMLAVAKAQVESIGTTAGDDDWNERWRNAVRTAGLVLRPEDAERLLAVIHSLFQLAPTPEGDKARPMLEGVVSRN